MCGFAGIIDFKKDITSEEHELENMVNTLVKRGPDQMGMVKYPHALLGHRRLIVVDPTHGQQPMTKTLPFGSNVQTTALDPATSHTISRDGYVYTLVYNGELYNTEDLRKDLIKEGFTFESYSDTEVLLTAYMCWGVDCVKRLNGIFAFAVYDEKENQVLCVRDQLGVKPFFYSVQDSSFIFGSEIKTVLAHSKVQPIVDNEGLTEIFALGPAVKPGSAVFKQIRELAPATLAIVKPDGSITLKEYWKLEAKENHESLDEATEHLRSLLVDAIQRQLVGDVPLCTFLSGGLDSSAISAVTAAEFKKQGKQLTTFSLDYEGNDKYFKASLYQPTSDPYWAAEMAKVLGSDHRVYTIKQDELAQALKAAMIARDLPGMADIDSSFLLFNSEIAKEFTIVLSGECADEVFGGYPWYTRPELRGLNTFPWSNFVKSRRALLAPALQNLPIEEVVNENYLDSLKRVPHLDGEDPHKFRTRELFYLNIKWFMVNLLNRADRTSMDCSLELRVPFADHKLVEYAFNIPDEHFVYQGREKGLLRRAMEPILPQDIIYRKKSPFPKTHNPIYTKIVSDMLQEILDDHNHPLFSIIDRPFAQKLLDTQGASYPDPWYGQLMTGPQLIAFIVQVGQWLETYKSQLV